MDDVYEPLTQYRDEFKNKFSTLARQKFQSLVKESGIDVNANRKQVGVVRGLETSLSSAKDKRSLFCTLMVLCYIGAVVGFLIAFANNESRKNAMMMWAVLGGIVSLGFAIWLTTLFSNIGDFVKSLEARVAAAKDVAWKQMAPLNKLYTWDITTKLIQDTVPRMAFDPFFSAQRLADLKKIYGWDDSFNEERSIVFAQSGVINGNPFLIGEYLEMEWGEETYTGELEIEWEELVEDEDGDVHSEVRSEILTASIDRPIPVYSKQKILIYGNDAAPSLTFSRHPSSLSGAEDGFITSMRKKWRLGRLKALSRDLDNSSFQLMSNHEFETIFNCRDRDNEVEFRLLYTALAQKQTLDLLKDKSVGFGDDFSFIKQKKLNFILSEHLNGASIDTGPANFYHWDYDNAAKAFLRFNEQYFKDIYFALAPLMAIPLYQQTRTHEDIWKGISYTDPSSFWEHEATANYLGDKAFEHPDCITKNILKTRVVSRNNGVSTVEVTAYGYRGVERLDYETVLGGDGHYHDVPIEWIEYLPVENTSDMVISEGHNPSSDFADAFRAAAIATDRRSILSFIPGAQRADGKVNALPVVRTNVQTTASTIEGHASSEDTSVLANSLASPQKRSSPTRIPLPESRFLRKTDKAKVPDSDDITSIRVMCPHCGAELIASTSISVGQHIRCESCGNRFAFQDEVVQGNEPADDVATTQTLCPSCGESLDIPVGLREGQHIECPYCSSKFAYAADGNNIKLG